MLIFYKLYSTEPINEGKYQEVVDLFVDQKKYKEIKYKNQIIIRTKIKDEMGYKIKTKLDAKSVREMYIDYIKYCNDSNLPFLEKVLYNEDDQKKLLEMKKKI